MWTGSIHVDYLASGVLRSDEYARFGSESVCGISMITFPIKKRIDTEMFIHRMAALYKGEDQIRVVTKKDV